MAILWISEDDREIKWQSGRAQSRAFQSLSMQVMSNVKIKLMSWVTDTSLFLLKSFFLLFCRLHLPFITWLLHWKVNTLSHDSWNICWWYFCKILMEVMIFFPNLYNNSNYMAYSKWTKLKLFFFFFFSHAHNRKLYKNANVRLDI